MSEEEILNWSLLFTEFPEIENVVLLIFKNVQFFKNCLPYVYFTDNILNL